MTLLAIEDVRQQFGALKVLNGISLAVPEGQALGVVGPNGAGKTTLLDIVAGGRRPGRGRVRLAGHDVTTASPGHRTRLGLGRTYQVPRPFGSMTVFENALVAAVRGAGLRRHAAHAAAYAALARTGLAAKANVPAHRLTLLERKRLELARALATEPSVLRPLFASVTGIAIAAAALAGTLNAVTTGVYPTLGALTLIFAFEAVIIGGLGSLWGTLLGGMLLGVTQVLVSQVSVPYAILASQLLFLVVLVVRPQGMFGNPQVVG